MHKLVWMCGIGVLGACAAAPDGMNGADGAADPATGVATQDSLAFSPMGFARITAGGVPGVAFDSASTLASPVTVSGGAGNYTVTFAGLGTASSADATGGNVQVTAEGTGNVRCRIVNWGGNPDLSVAVQCATPGGTVTASAFSVMFFRYAMPAPNSFPATAAYLWRPTAGTAPHYDYNSTGTHNMVSGSGGSYSITIPGATANNASMMVTSYGGTAATGAVCSIAGWGVPTVNIECRDAANHLVDTAFSFSYSFNGPAQSQQGAHAWFDGAAANTFYSAALGKIEGCSAVSITGSRAGSLVTMTVSGDLGPWDASPFLRASFASGYGTASYCKVESLTASGAAPSSTATTTLRCYDATGAVIAAPRLTFTHATSDASGPC